MKITGYQSAPGTSTSSAGSNRQAGCAPTGFSSRLGSAATRPPDLRDLAGGRLPSAEDVLSEMGPGLEGARSGLRDNDGLGELRDGMAGIGTGALVGCLIGGAATGGPGCLPGAAAGAEASTIAAAIIAFFKAIAESLSEDDDDDGEESERGDGKKTEGNDDGKGKKTEDDKSICEPRTPWEELQIVASASPGVSPGNPDSDAAGPSGPIGGA